MTDGTTGFHVAPISEDDMNRVQSILKRAADAIVGMSQLHADVDMLRTTVASLQADTERLRSQNNALDEALNHSRSVRDEQARKLAEVDNMLIVANNQAIQYMHERDKLQLSEEQLQIDFDLTRKAKDEAEFRVLELEDKLAQAEAKLAQIATAMGYVPTPIAVAKPEPEGASLSSILGHPAPTSEPAKPDTVTEWEPGYYWDGPSQTYRRNDLPQTEYPSDKPIF